MSKGFNYVVPIFNKEDILPLTLEGINKCASINSKIFAIIDGCTDSSEKIVDEFARSTGRNVVKLHMPNVHMLRSVNVAMAKIQSGFTVVMQDDIVLQDEDMEDKVESLYERMGPKLGIVSLRLASNIRNTSLRKRIAYSTLSSMIEESDYIQSCDDVKKYPVLESGKFYPRMSAINGPNIVPFDVINKVGILDERLAPYGYDDPEYCLRAMKAGYINGLFPLSYRSDIEWGVNRRSKKFQREVLKIHGRNRRNIWKWHGQYIDWLIKTGRVHSELTCVDHLNDILDCSLVAFEREIGS